MAVGGTSHACQTYSLWGGYSLLNLFDGPLSSRVSPPKHPLPLGGDCPGTQNDVSNEGYSLKMSLLVYVENGIDILMPFMASEHHSEGWRGST